MAIVDPTPETIEAAAAALRRGQLVAFPTETVYGLGADATNAAAVAAIYEAKGRPRFNPLIVHVAGADAASAVGILSPVAMRLASALWPGPLTMVLRRQPGSRVHDLATAGLDTVAVRVPAHPIAKAMLAAAGIPVVAPSANRSGHVSATTAAHVEADLGAQAAFILDGGRTAIGLESTVVDCTGSEPVVLRLGAITRERIEGVVGHVVTVADAKDPHRPQSPGMLERHYAPHTPIRLDARSVDAGEALLAFGAQPLDHRGAVYNLSASGDLAEAAANLFVALRTLDAGRPRCIAVMPIPDTGLGEAINDRLKRAAATP